MDDRPNPDVSVLLTVYRRTEYLRESLESALAQTLPSFEILVVDDSNSPAIRAIIEAYPDPRVRYRPNPTNLGVATSLREALPDCRGRYVSILNDDDAWEPTFLEKLLAALEADPRRDLAFCDIWSMDETGSVDVAGSDASSEHWGRAALPPGDVADLPAFGVVTNGIPLAMGSMFRRSALDPAAIVPEVVGAYDYWIVCLLAASGSGAFYVKERLTRYRYHAGMETSRKAPDKNENMVYIYRELLRRDAFPALRPWLRQRLVGMYRLVAEDRIGFGQPAAARGPLLASLRLQPSLRTTRRLLGTFRRR